jgi:hypothetical protein
VCKRHPNHRLVKIHRCYTVAEVAQLFGSHRNTVRRWIADGLVTLDHRRPILVHGRDLAAFLQARRIKNKRICQPGEMYCFRCHAPRFPAAAMADCRPVTEKISNLTGICPVCETIMNRRISSARIAEVSRFLEITFPQAPLRIFEINQPSVNSDFEGGAKSNASTQP